MSITRLSRRRRILTGTVSDPDGVERVAVAVGRRVRKPARCRWWSKKAGRLPPSRAAARVRAGSAPRSTGADDARAGWPGSAASLPAGRYRVLIADRGRSGQPLDRPPAAAVGQPIFNSTITFATNSSANATSSG